MEEADKNEPAIGTPLGLGNSPILQYKELTTEENMEVPLKEIFFLHALKTALRQRAFSRKSRGCVKNSSHR